MPRALSRSALERAAAAIVSGGVVACPTETFYGLAVDPRRREAVDTLYAIKSRTPGRPVGLVAASASQVEATIGVLPEFGTTAGVAVLARTADADRRGGA